MRNKDSGLTLVELLISIFIAGLIMVLVAVLFSSTARSTVYINKVASLTKEGQIAQQLISGHLGEALYVWPSGVTPNLLLTSSGITSKNTIDSTLSSSTNWQWKFGSTSSSGNSLYYEDTANKIPYDLPFVAMILPPEAPTYDTSGNINNCLGTGYNTTFNATTTVATGGCYRFYAYFPMRRSYLTSSSLAASSKPAADTLNDLPSDAVNDRWVIMEYRANLYDSSMNTTWLPNYAISGSSTSGITNLPSATLFQGRPANVLVDYVKPASLSFTVYRPDAGGSATTTSPVVGLANGKIVYTFIMEQITSAAPNLQTITASSGTLGGTVVPQNWFCSKAIDTTNNLANCP